VTDGQDADVLDFLGGLEHDELVRRLVALSARDEVALMALRAEAAAAAGRFDLAAFRKELTARLRISGFLDHRQAKAYAQRAEEILDVLESLLAGGRAADLIAAAEHVIARLDTALNRIDDSSGYLGSVTSRLQEIHHAACAAAKPDPRKLGVRLVEIELKTNWEWFLDAPERYADVLGDEGLAEYRARLEREWEALPQLPPVRERPFLSRFDAHRSTVTFLRESLARASGSVDELVSVLAHDLSSPYHFCRIADELEGAGREREALAWLERGAHAFPPAGDAQLRSRLVCAYLRDGQVEDAVQLTRRAFDAEPSSRTYAELRHASAGTVEEQSIRMEALERLRRAGPLGGRSEAVRAQLDEGALEGAWRDACEGGCTWDLWRRLADARRDEHPDDALDVYRRHLDDALQQADNRSYEAVVGILSAIRDTLAPYGRNDEFAAEVERVREEYRRRPRLLAMLTAAGW
jgi:uncharacterized Zn finger protein